MIDSYHVDGAVLIKGLFRDWAEIIRQGIEINMAEPGPYASENLREGHGGRFSDDYCNWQRIEEFEQVIRQSQVGGITAQLTGSKTVQIFHNHVLVKEPATKLDTPWHQDAPCYFVDGE